MLIENKILTMADVQKLNDTSGEENLVRLLSTKGQNPRIIAQLNKNVRIQILGGYAHKQYAGTKYRERTYYSPQHVADIINVYKQIESNIDAKWTELEKVFYLYVTTVLYLDYDIKTFIFSEWEKDKIVEPFGDEKTITSAGKLFRNKLYHSFQEKEDIPSTYRNLCCMLTRTSHCAGFANCLKESLDRVGIKNRIVHYANLHTANVVCVNKRQILMDPSFENTDLHVGVNEHKKLTLTKNFGTYGSEYEYLQKQFPRALPFINVNPNLKYNKVSTIEKLGLCHKILPKSIETVEKIVTPSFEEDKPIIIKANQEPTLEKF